MCDFCTTPLDYVAFSKLPLSPLATDKICDLSLKDVPDLLVSQDDLFSESFMPEVFLSTPEVELPFQQEDIERTR